MIETVARAPSARSDLLTAARFFTRFTARAHENDGLDFFIGPTEILLRISLDGGVTFSDIINLTSSTGKVSGPRQTTLLNDTLYVVWEERPPSFGKTAAPSEILFVRVDHQRNDDEIPGGASTESSCLNSSKKWLRAVEGLAKKKTTKKTKKKTTRKK